ncbi:unannotated protein [freshwater metagenome]|uniref:Unannotated protein n=1 Tax=freshwater metagenome TaxID=449393 RepID=A0A6J7FYG9_9ZZZZ
MVFVSVGQDHCQNVVETVTNRREIRQDEVDPRLIFFGKENPTVDDEKLAVEFVDRHVAADFAEATHRDNAQGALFEGGRIKEVVGHVSHS